MSDTEFAQWPIVGRWTQAVSGGKVIWHLAALHEDRRFWGYAHFRTDQRSENRSFEGVLTSEAFSEIESLINRLLQNPDDGIPAGVLDGVIGVGTRSSFRRLIGVNEGKSLNDDLCVVSVYESFVELLQPILIRAIRE